MNRERNDDGQFVEAVDEQAVYEVVTEIVEGADDRARPVTAGDVMERLDVSRQTAHNKLQALVETDVLATRAVGARGRVYWLPAASTDGEDETSVQIGAKAVSIVEELELPGSGEKLERNREVVRAAYQFLEERDAAPRSAFEEELYPEYPSVYSRPDGSWWRKVVKPGLKAHPEVIVPDGGGAWRYNG